MDFPSLETFRQVCWERAKGELSAMIAVIKGSSQELTEREIFTITHTQDYITSMEGIFCGDAIDYPNSKTGNASRHSETD